MHPSDTHPDALREQVRLLRDAGPTRRFAAARSLSRTLLSLARRQVRTQMPDASEEELRAALARRLYGDRVVRELEIGTAARA